MGAEKGGLDPVIWGSGGKAKVIAPNGMETLSAELHLDTGNGHGSTNTAIRRFSTVNLNTLGVYATYADSAANGMSVTINVTGKWAIYYADNSTTPNTNGISLNSSALTTSIVTLTYAQGKRLECSHAAGGVSSCSDIFMLSANDVIRAHTNTSVDGTANRTIFRIQYLGI